MTGTIIHNILRFLAVLLNSIAAIILILLLLAGTNNGLTSLYYLKVRRAVSTLVRFD
jgi:hypothetical protein